VVGDSGGARESLIDGETGLLVDGRRTGDVVEAIASILSDPARAEKMGRAGRARVERDHDWSKIAARLGIWLQAAAR
jgi:phosphatidylinositol alpha-1,6-mannosyltransferase